MRRRTVEIGTEDATIIFKHQPIRMVLTTRDGWADHCAKWRCHGCEPTRKTLLHIHSETIEPIGLISYLDSKKYFINPSVKTPPDISR